MVRSTSHEAPIHAVGPHPGVVLLYLGHYLEGLAPLAAPVELLAVVLVELLALTLVEPLAGALVGVLVGAPGHALVEPRDGALGGAPARFCLVSGAVSADYDWAEVAGEVAVLATLDSRPSVREAVATAARVQGGRRLALQVCQLP